LRLGILMRLENKRCLIVGGTSGLGLAAARRFLAEGARLVIAGNDDIQGEEALQALGRPAAVRFVQCDATLSAEVDRLYVESVSFLQGLDVLYHTAGGSGRRYGDGPLDECTEEGFIRTLDLNLRSTFLTNRAAVRHFLTRGQPGAILNLASVLALAPSPRYFDTAAYAAAKGAVIALSRQTAARYAPDGIRVNVLAPGLIDTPMAARAVNDPAIAAFLQSKQPLGPGAGEPDDCSEAAVFLCGDAARFITGVVLPVDGGWRLSEGQFS
jgi:NAD(P)-dependent dehydrogenase (short-subunit alcohol dehydrogenase family)